MPVFTKGDVNVLFIHIPKTAGSSVTALFRSRGWGITYEDRSSLTTPGDPNFLRTVSPQHMHAQLIEGLFDLSRFDLVFSLTRHPIDRFRSEFTFRHPSLDLSKLTPETVENWWNQQMSNFKLNKSILDNHLRPQVDFITKTSRVLRLESGLGEVSALERGINPELSSSKELVDALVPFENRGNFESSLVPISKKLSKALSRFYRKDFELSGY